jgi:hypothetical protein
MDDGYQHVVRGPRIDRKPDRAALDAAMDADMRGPQPLRWHNPSIYIEAVAHATVGTNLIKEMFETIIAQNTNSPTPDVNPERLQVCDPTTYTTAIDDATLNGRLSKDFFDKFVAARAFYRVLRTEHPPLAIRQSIEPRGSDMPRAQWAQVPDTHQNDGAQVYHDHQRRSSQTLYTPQPNDDEVRLDILSRPQSVQRHESSDSLNDQTNPYSPEHTPDQLHAQTHDDRFQHERFARFQSAQRHESSGHLDTQTNRHSTDQLHTQTHLRHPLPEQSATWAAVRRGRNYGGGRDRSRSPIPFDRASPSDHPGRQPDHFQNDQEEDTTLRDRYRDRSPNFYTGASPDYLTHGVPTLSAPEAAQEPARDASLHHSPHSVSDHRHHTEEPHLTGDARGPIDDHRPVSASSQTDHPPAYHPLHNDHSSHAYNTPDYKHGRVQGDRRKNAAFASASMAVQTSTMSQIERMLQKNQSTVCVECWSRGLKCDSQAVCRGCARADRPCTYVECPLKDCSRSITCPAYHPCTGDDTVRFVGSSMHLMALLRLDPPSSLDYNLTPIRNMYSKSDSAAEIYSQIAFELKEAARNGQEIHRVFVKQLVLEQGLTCRALMYKVDLIVTFFAEKK